MPLHRRVKILQTPWLCGPEVVFPRKKKNESFSKGEVTEVPDLAEKYHEISLAFCKETLRKPNPSDWYCILRISHHIICLSSDNYIYIYILFSVFNWQRNMPNFETMHMGHGITLPLAMTPHIAMEKSPFFSIGKSSIDNGLSIP